MPCGSPQTSTELHAPKPHQLPLSSAPLAPDFGGDGTPTQSGGPMPKPLVRVGGGGWVFVLQGGHAGHLPGCACAPAARRCSLTSRLPSARVQQSRLRAGFAALPFPHRPSHPATVPGTAPPGWGGATCSPLRPRIRGASVPRVPGGGSPCSLSLLNHVPSIPRLCTGRAPGCPPLTASHPGHPPPVPDRDGNDNSTQGGKDSAVLISEGDTGTGTEALQAQVRTRAGSCWGPECAPGPHWRQRGQGLPPSGATRGNLCW